MLKHTPTTSPTFETMKQAAESIAKVADFCNTKVQEIEQNERMAELQRKLKLKVCIYSFNILTNVENLIIPTRRLIRESEVEGDFSRIRGKNKEMIVPIKGLYLFSDLLVCVTKRKKIGIKIIQVPLKSNQGNPIQIGELSKG